MPLKQTRERPSESVFPTRDARDRAERRERAPTPRDRRDIDDATSGG